MVLVSFSTVHYFYGHVFFPVPIAILFVLLPMGGPYFWLYLNQQRRVNTAELVGAGSNCK